MSECHPWLNCTDIDTEVAVIKHIGEGAVKHVYLGIWKEYRIVVNKMKHFQQDFEEGLKNLIAFQPDSRVVQLVGFCEESHVFLTEYHQLKSADRVELFLSKHNHLDTLQNRFKLCLHYVEIINFLHNSPKGVRVMCDSNEPLKALSQLLVREDLSLALNDADALPQVNESINQLIKCGHVELTGDQVAPEQLWPFDSDFEDYKMPPYDEKSDIWKIPDICKLLLNNKLGSINILLKLFNINSQCKNEDPVDRPSAQNVLLAYEQVYNDMFNSSKTT